MLRVDAHRHLGGCISPKFVWDMIEKTKAYHLGESYGEVVSAMEFAPGEETGFHRFLDKFNILDAIDWTEDLLVESIKQVSADIIQDRIDFTPLRFSVNKYVKSMKCHRRDLIKLVADTFRQYAGSRVGLVLALKYESQRASQRQLAALVEDPMVAENVIGLDLVGDETYYDSGFYAPLFKDWAKYGKIIMAHVGESHGIDNVETAIMIGVTDLCHGIAAFPNPINRIPARDRQRYLDLHDRMRSLDICCHMAIGSNLLTGTWARSDWHPVMGALEAEVPVTIGTDDPVQCGTCLDMEYIQAAAYGVGEAGLQTLQETAVKRFRRFLPSNLQ
jgi:adenosine deaminase